MKENYLKSLLSLSLFLLSGCVTAIPDSNVCVELSPMKAGCVRIVSGTKTIIDDNNPIVIEGKPYTYWEVRPFMIQVPPESWAELKAFIIKMCKKYESACQKEASSWDRTIVNIDDQIGLKR